MSRAIAVIGQGAPDGGPAADAARSVGRLLAQAGATVVTGGLGGVMAAAGSGARAAGGRVTAILPGTDRRAAREADTVVCSGVGEARDLAVVASADAVIAVGGGWGTLAEIGLARKLGRPVVLLGSWSIAEPGAPPGASACPTAASPEAAVRMALEAAR
ncbi:MAG TPA: hypothetical protein VHK23_03335 [Miltoncostaeaceae bacterium]|jgi:uncharacterized protein (TIGR00725 family)|nr:hypothetical protein [Miltoncostaeaceae bacterium]